MGKLTDAQQRRRLAKDGADVVIQELAENKELGWATAVVWGLENVSGSRLFIRTNVTTRRYAKVIARLVYDFKPEA